MTIAQPVPPPFAVVHVPFEVRGKARDAEGMVFDVPSGGRVNLTCSLSATQTLKDCRIESESPAGLRLGYAAQRIAEGQPPAAVFALPMSGRPDLYMVSIDFGRTRLQEGSSVPFLDFVEAPVVEQVRAVAPASAASENVLVSFNCMMNREGRLQNCTVEDGSRGGAEVVRAARSLLPLFLVDMGRFKKMAKTIPFDLEGLRAPLAVSFSARVLYPGSPRYIRRVDWLQTAGSDDLKAAYPPQAMAAGAKAGSATLDCAIVQGGALDGCSVLKEEPAGLGFGDAAVKVSLRMKANAWTRDGEPSAGARIRLPFDLTLDDTASARDRN